MASNKLGSNLFEASLERHPSIKGLYDENGKLKSPTDSNDEFFILNLNKEYENEMNYKNNKKEDVKQLNDEKSKMSVKINRVKEKTVDYKDTFYVEMNDEDKKNILNKNDGKDPKAKGEPISYAFNESQKKFDKEITDSMSKGEEYSKIEGKFMNQLKKK